MRSLYLVTIAATVWLGACTTDGGVSIKCTINGETKEFVTAPGKENCEQIRSNPAVANAPTTPITPSTTPVVPGTEPVTPTPVFTAPVVAQTTPGFLEPTNKAQRQEELSTRLSSTERDPFATIPGSVPPPPAPPAPAFVPRVPSPTTLTPQIKLTPVEPPSTVEASAVLVSGILDIGGNRYAIINAPGEPTSRSVALGQTFVNGKVLFKQIKNVSGTTFVILEQNGVEVIRPVGKQTIATTSNR